MRTTILTTAAALATVTTADAQTWAFDKSHSKVQFAVTHLVISETVGQFTEWDGTVTATKEDFTDAQINFTIKVASINTDNTDRDNHLRSADFFDVQKYPLITFKSTRVDQGAGGLTVLGDLTIHGVTKSVALEVEGPTDEIKDPYGNLKMGASGSTKIKRKDFGLTWNAALEAGGVLVGDEVTIQLDVQFIKQV